MPTKTSLAIRTANVDLSIPGALTRTGWIPPEDMAFGDWEHAGERFAMIQGATLWWIGDWLNYGERAYGEKYQESQALTGYAYGTLRNAKMVAKSIELSRRRDNSPWAIHQEVAPLDAEDQDFWLGRAENEGMTRPQLRAEIRKARTQETPALPNGQYAVIVADPPWPYDEGWPEFADKAGENNRRRELPYQAMSLNEITVLPIADLAAADAHLLLWTTNRYLRDAYGVAEAWGFTPSQTLVWCKPPRGIGPGGIFSNTAEFIIYARRGTPVYKQRIDSTWWTWPRRKHSAKPASFLDLIEQAFDGPYVELFAREPRRGWTAWGLEA